MCALSERLENFRNQRVLSAIEPPWPNGQGVGLLIRRLWVRVPQGVIALLVCGALWLSALSGAFWRSLALSGFVLVSLRFFAFLCVSLGCFAFLCVSLGCFAFRCFRCVSSRFVGFVAFLWVFVFFLSCFSAAFFSHRVLSPISS